MYSNIFLFVLCLVLKKNEKGYKYLENFKIILKTNIGLLLIL